MCKAFKTHIFFALITTVTQSCVYICQHDFLLVYSSLLGILPARFSLHYGELIFKNIQIFSSQVKWLWAHVPVCAVDHVHKPSARELNLSLSLWVQPVTQNDPCDQPALSIHLIVSSSQQLWCDSACLQVFVWCNIALETIYSSQFLTPESLSFRRQQHSGPHFDLRWFNCLLVVEVAASAFFLTIYSVSVSCPVPSPLVLSPKCERSPFFFRFRAKPSQQSKLVFELIHQLHHRGAAVHRYM